jgi:hypothetical protein
MQADQWGEAGTGKKWGVQFEREMRIRKVHLKVIDVRGEIATVSTFESDFDRGGSEPLKNVR